MKRGIEIYTDEQDDPIMAVESCHGEIWYAEKDEPEGTERTWDGFLQELFNF